MLGQCRELLNVTLAVRPTFVDGDEVRRKRSFTDDCTGDFGGRGRIVASRIFLHIPAFWGPANFGTRTSCEHKSHKSGDDGVPRRM
ncbi:unnamed protein product [Prorocentrum cordatum]|nr:unnamed protein product [Polarella glacialis]